MEQKFHYAIVTEAIEELRKEGYTLDFFMKGTQLMAGDQAYRMQDFAIAELYRYEGASDPADAAMVYALISGSGVKGILVTAYGVSADDEIEIALRELHYKYQFRS